MLTIMYFTQWIARSGKTQGAIAHQLGVTRSYINMIAAGKKKPSWTVASRILEITHGEVTANDLIAEFSVDE
tara:strand:- start:1934 stop:2149 length:216 start_codon:yes stop_codon:yes gene_type:complete